VYFIHTALVLEETAFVMSIKENEVIETSKIEKKK